MSAKKADQKVHYELPPDSTLEQRLEAATRSFNDLAPKLAKEQTSRRNVIIGGAVLFVFLGLLVFVSYLDARHQTNKTNDAVAALDTVQTSLCNGLKDNRTFSVTSLNVLQESLIASFVRPDPDRTPEQQANLDTAIANFRQDLADRIKELPPIKCEVANNGNR